MLIDVKCPACRETIPVLESAAEQKIDCHGCGKKFAVPGTGSPAKPPEPKGKAKDRDEPRGKKSAPLPPRRRR